MSERDDDDAELQASREALQTAKLSAVKVDAAAQIVHKASAEIQTIVDRNGYVDRFRLILRGA